MSLDRLGLVKTSLIDYPGEVAAVIFTAGCNLRCPFCQNPGLVSGTFPEDFLSKEEVLSFLARRAGILGGVCITGGEPLIHEDLPELTDQIRRHGLKTKIDTNGTFRSRLAEISPDFVSLDLKTSPEKYHRLLPEGHGLQLELFDAESDLPPGIWVQVQSTLEWIAESGREFEVRTTVVPDLVSIDDIKVLADFLADNFRSPLQERGNYVLAGFRPENVLDPSFAAIRPYPVDVLETMAAIVRQRGISCSIRPNLPPGTAPS